MSNKIVKNITIVDEENEINTIEDDNNKKIILQDEANNKNTKEYINKNISMDNTEVIKKTKLKKENKKILTIDEDNDNNIDLDITKINELLGIHIDYVSKIKNFIEKNNNKVKLRLPNFPEYISENIIKEYIKIKEKRECKKIQQGGDLVINNKKIEVKCFTSDGPSSFGPNEEWIEIYFLDAKDFLNGNFIIYKINASNDSEIFSKIKINSEKTYEDVCKEGKRPRINFNEIKKQLKDKVELVYQGKLNF